MLKKLLNIQSSLGVDEYVNFPKIWEWTALYGFVCKIVKVIEQHDPVRLSTIDFIWFDLVWCVGIKNNKLNNLFVYKHSLPL